MKWEMDMAEVEAILEKIWDLHDKISDAILGISRAHFLKSISATTAGKKKKKHQQHAGGGVVSEDGRSGFVFVKDFGAYVDVDDKAIAEARSLNAIRTALENLEDQLEFFHSIQSHQRVERDAAIARLEQSRIILAMRLADHHGNKYKVIEEALDFVGNIHDAGQFAGQENMFDKARSQSSDNLEVNANKKSNILMQMLMSGMTLAKKSVRSEGIGGIVGNAALFAMSMLAIFQLHQVAFKNDCILDAPMQKQASPRNRMHNFSSRYGSPSNDNDSRRLDVLSARG